MTPDEAIEAGKLMIAWGKGKVKHVQWRRKTLLGAWHRTTKLGWDWTCNEYRAAPELKYRPYTIQEASNLIGKFLIDHKYHQTCEVTKIIIDKAYVKIYLWEPSQWFFPEDLLEKYTNSDGTPCGVLEVEE